MRFRSPLLSQSRFLSFPPGTEMVHFPGFAHTQLWIRWAVWRFYLHGFPHSEIPGSKPACGSPRLIAACHVLHRRLLPRHPPCALSSLTIKFTQHTRIASITPRKLYSATLAPRTLRHGCLQRQLQESLASSQPSYLGKITESREEVLRTPAR